MNIDYTVYVTDIDRDYYEETVDEVLANIFYYDLDNLKNISNLEAIKDGIIHNIDKIIRFPEEFSFNATQGDTNNIEDYFWEILYKRLYKTLKTKLSDDLFVEYKNDVDLKEYEYESWDEYINDYISNNYIVIYNNDNFVCYINQKYLLDLID